MTAAVLFLLS